MQNKATRTYIQMTLAHVDDCLVLGKEAFIDDVFREVGKRLKITTTAFNEPVDFIGCWIRWVDGRIEADEEAYIDKILTRHGMEDCKEYSTPFSPCTVRIVTLP